MSDVLRQSATQDHRANVIFFPRNLHCTLLQQDMGKGVSAPIATKPWHG